MTVGLIVGGAFLFLGCPMVIIVCIAAITALGSNANSTFQTQQGVVKPSFGGAVQPGNTPKPGKGW